MSGNSAQDMPWRIAADTANGSLPFIELHQEIGA
jgi:hypothetical protein